MNQTLAQLYGLSTMSKTASDEANVDLTQISAADYLAALEQEDPGEGELDLSQMSAQELIDLANQEDESEGDPIEKMASSGELAYWDSAGRIMAHAYNDELQKVASAEDEVFDIDDLSAAELVELIESGEFELIEKTAALFGPAQKGLKGLPFRARQAMSRMSDAASSTSGASIASSARKAGKRAKELLTGSKVRETVNARKKFNPDKSKARLYGEQLTSRGSSEARKSLAAQGAAAGTAGAAVGGGAYALKKKKDKK